MWGGARCVLLQGCAGAGKTRTILDYVQAHSQDSSLHTLILTLVTSVTQEIAGRIRELHAGCTPLVQGNHLCFRGPRTTISNFDAFVHHTLMRIPDAPSYLEGRYGSQWGCLHDAKVHTLLHFLSGTEELPPLCTRWGSPFDLLIVDEVQDLDPIRTKLLVLLSRSVLEAGGRVLFAGDRLQTIFQPVGLRMHPMDVLRDDLQPDVRSLVVCRRCPDAHVQWVNEVAADWRAQWGVPAMEASGKPGPRPVLFSHGSLQTPHEANLLAKRLARAVRELLHGDDTLQPADFAFLSRRVNANRLFELLEERLQRTFRRALALRAERAAIAAGEDPVAAVQGLPKKRYVRYLATKQGMQNQSISWGDASEQAVLLSIAGDKGKGHRVVFLLGVTEGSIPDVRHPGTTDELASHSLLYVGLTRSTQWLFVGVHQTNPSRYMVRSALSHERLCVRAWDIPLWDDTREAAVARVMERVARPDTPNIPLRKSRRKDPFAEPREFLPALRTPPFVYADVNEVVSQLPSLPDWLADTVVFPVPSRERDEIEWDPSSLPMDGLLARHVWQVLQGLVLEHVCGHRRCAALVDQLDDPRTFVTTDEGLFLASNQYQAWNKNTGDVTLDFRSWLARDPDALGLLQSEEYQRFTEVCGLDSHDRTLLLSNFFEPGFREEVASQNWETDPQSLWTQALLSCFLDPQLRCSWRPRAWSWRRVATSIPFDVYRRLVSSAQEWFAEQDGVLCACKEPTRRAFMESRSDVLEEVGAKAPYEVGWFGEVDLRTDDCLWMIGKGGETDWVRAWLLAAAREDDPDIGIVDLGTGTWARWKPSLGTLHVRRKFVQWIGHRADHAETLVYGPLQ